MSNTSDLESGLKKVRNTLLRVRVVETGLRWALYGALLLCLYLIFAKIFRWDKDVAWGFGIFPIVAIGWILIRRMTLKECAQILDRTFGLEERLSTAVELIEKRMVTPMSKSQWADATAAFFKIPLYHIRRVHARREGALFCGATFFALILAISPDLPFSQEMKEDRVKEMAKGEAVKLQALLSQGQDLKSYNTEAKQLILEANKLAEALLTGQWTPQEALHRLQELQAKMAEASSKLSLKTPLPIEATLLNQLQERLGAAGAALASEMGKQGLLQKKSPEELYRELLTKFQPVPRAQGNKDGATLNPSDPFGLSEFVQNLPALEGSTEANIVQEVHKVLQQKTWPVEYDFVVKQYYRSEESKR